MARTFRPFPVAIAALSITIANQSAAVSNIDPSSSGQKFGWAENGGWLNLQGNISQGVRVSAAYLEGFAWHENFGWINFGDGSPVAAQYSNSSASDFGVNRSPTGDLSGYAWGENVGWISFDTTSSDGSKVSVEPATGRFRGYAWAENVGWVAFDTVPVSQVAHIIPNASIADWTVY